MSRELEELEELEDVLVDELDDELELAELRELLARAAELQARLLRAIEHRRRDDGE